MGVYSGVPGPFHDNVVQPDDGVHGGADLVGHVCQKLAFGDVGFLRLLPHPFDLIDIGLDVRHVQDQDDAALLPAVFVDNPLAVALVMLPVDGKAPGDVFVEHLLPEILHHPDILPQLMGGQADEDLGGGPVVADQPVVVVQGDHAVPQALQHLFRRQMPEVVVPAAPHHDDHQGHGEGQCRRGQVEHLGELAHVGHQHDDGHGGDCKYGLILAVNPLVRTEADGPRQGMDAKNVGDEDAGHHKKNVEGAVGNADVGKAALGGQPLKLPVEQAVPVEKYTGQYKKVDGAQDAQQFFGRGRVAVSIRKPAVAQRDKRGTHVFHRYRRHGGLQRGSGELQQIARVLHKRAAHNEDQQLLLLGPFSIDQQQQSHKNQAYAAARQGNDKVFHSLLHLPEPVVLCPNKGARWALIIFTIVLFRHDVKEYNGKFYIGRVGSVYTHK